MPSYRTILTVTTLAPGRAPEEVEQAARTVTRLESWDIAIVARQPRITARFTAVDDAEARTIHAAITDAVREVADVPRARLAAVMRGRSHYLPPRGQQTTKPAQASSRTKQTQQWCAIAHALGP